MILKQGGEARKQDLFKELGHGGDKSNWAVVAHVSPRFAFSSFEQRGQQNVRPNSWIFAEVEYRIE